MRHWNDEGEVKEENEEDEENRNEYKQKTYEAAHRIMGCLRDADRAIRKPCW